MSAWRDRLAALTVREAGECPDGGLTKPPKAPCVSFGSAQNEHSTSKSCAPGIATMRAHLLKLAAEEGIPSSVVDRMTDADVAAYAAVPDFTDLNYRAHLRALHAARRMDAGMIPLDWGEPHARTCEGCGPVLLWEACPDVVKACPWCFRRKAGKRIPRPRVQVANGVLNGFTDKGVTTAMRETLRAMRGQS